MFLGCKMKFPDIPQNDTEEKFKKWLRMKRKNLKKELLRRFNNEE